MQNGWVLCLRWVCFRYAVCRTGQNESVGKNIKKGRRTVKRRRERKEGKMEGKEGWRKVRKGCEGREEPFMAVDKTLGMVGEICLDLSFRGFLLRPCFGAGHHGSRVWKRNSRPRMKQRLGSDRGSGRMKSVSTRNTGETSEQAQFTHSSAGSSIYLPSFPPPGRIYIYTEPPVFLTVVLKSKLSLLQPKHICFSLL